MTFNLKNTNADEIASAMADSLGIKKIAKVLLISLGAYKIVLNLAGCEKINGKLHYDNVRIAGVEPFMIKRTWEEVAKRKNCADDGQCLDDDVVAAMNFALKHLVKVADELDANGFEELASLLDDDIGKFTATPEQAILPDTAAGLPERPPEEKF